MTEFYMTASFFLFGLISLLGALGYWPEYILLVVCNLRYFAFGPCYRKFTAQPLQPPSLARLETLISGRPKLYAKRVFWRKAEFLLIRRRMLFFGRQTELPPFWSSPRMLLLSEEAEGRQKLTLECRHPLSWPLVLGAFLCLAGVAAAINHSLTFLYFFLICVGFAGIPITLSLYNAWRVAGEVWGLIENAEGPERTDAPGDESRSDLREFHLRKKQLNWSFALITAVAVGIIIAGAWRESGPPCATELDYGKLPPAEVFKMVMGQQIPEGVTGLEIAGHGFNRGDRVWMRFQANDMAIRRLTASAKRISRDEAAGGINFGYFRHPNKKLDAGRELTRRDAFQVHWQEIMQAQAPEFYQLEKGRGKTAWDTIIGFDRERGEAYVHAGK